MQERTLAKAKLIELKPDLTGPKTDKPYDVTVQFNPETLKVAFQNQIATPSGPGSPTRLFVGAGTTKLSLQVWFDVTAPLPTGAGSGSGVDDVRKLTEKVAYFITPKKEGESYIPPAVRFLWGTFQFDGIVDSMEESLEFFSPEGRPLRASVSLGLSQQKIQSFAFGKAGAAQRGPGGRATSPGTRPLAPAAANSTLQGMTSAHGAGLDWQSVAAANGIENPLRLTPGQLIDTAAAGRVSFGF
jgi:hypothetical protein